MARAIPIFKAPKRRRRPDGKKRSLIEAAGLAKAKAPKKQAKPPTPSSQMSKEGSKPRGRSLASGLASAAMAMPSGGYSGVAKSALAGAAAGAEIEASYREYKKERTKKRATKAKMTISKSAMSQKAKYHKKDDTKTKRV